MKKLFLTLSSMVLLIGISIFLLYSRNNLKDVDIHTSLIEDIEEVDTNEIEEDQEDENITENIEIDNNDVKTNSSSIHNSNKNDIQSNNVSNANVLKDNKTKPIEETKSETTTSNTIQEVKVENKVEETTKIIEEVRDDIVDTNSWFYSIHHGKIETSTQDNCLSAGNEISFIDTVDINYYRCYEVTSTTGKVLGYYLNIFCNSDNCNRYKNQIDMSKYK